jgi:inactivated superfamily I helicase
MSTDTRVREAATARDEGMAIAEYAARAEQILAVDRVIAEAIESGEPFSANTIRDRMPTVRSGLIGSRIKAASMRSEPRLVCVGEEMSTLKSTHLKPIKRWQVAS